jgi:nicotinate phosphoribosyltransferase
VATTDEGGLLTAAGIALLTDQYELAMAASYLRRGMNDDAVFELFVRHLPPGRGWLLAAGLGPALALAEQLRFGAPSGDPRTLGSVAGLASRRAA